MVTEYIKLRNEVWELNRKITNQVWKEKCKRKRLVLNRLGFNLRKAVFQTYKDYHIPK